MQHKATQMGRDEVAIARGRRFSWLTKGVSIVLGMVVAGVGAYAATNWVVGLASNSSGEAQSATLGKLTITATSSPAPGDLLDPGDSGDVVISIANANPYPVTITAV